MEVDIRKFFDSLDHEHLRGILRRRVRDGVLLRLIGKWLNAGVLEGLELSYPEAGAPQGGVISPLLANVYLHEVVDQWFARDVRPRLRGRAQLIRYADDLVMAFERQDDARRVHEVLPKRLEKFGLVLHPEKTRLLEFRRPARRPRGDSVGSGTYDFLGFTHYWGRSRWGAWVIKRRTARDRFSRGLRRVRQWCRQHRHDAVSKQHAILGAKLRGHYAYYGITSNFDALQRFHQEVLSTWRKWLSRRSQAGHITWERWHALIKRLPLPAPRIVHRYGT